MEEWRTVTPADHYPLYAEYLQKHGWPSDRLVWTLARVGSYLVAAMTGGKTKIPPSEFVPKIDRTHPISAAEKFQILVEESLTRKAAKPTT